MGLMPADETGPLSGGLLDRLGDHPAPGVADLTGPRQANPGQLAADLAVLRDHGYLTLALPTRFGGAGLNLAEVACAQRQLAARAPATAWAVNAHHARVGAAADALNGGERAEAGQILATVARGQLITGSGGTGEGDALIAGRYAWGLTLDGMIRYAVARRRFDLVVERASHRTGEAGGGHPLDQWPVAEAALRLDDIRGQLDEAIAGWRARGGARGAPLRPDPGR